MLDITTDIQSLTTFRRSSGDFMKHLKKSKRPIVLTVNGKAAAVVQDAEAYQRLVDMAARADAPQGQEIFERQIVVAQKVMRERRKVLRRLAK